MSPKKTWPAVILLVFASGLVQGQTTLTWKFTEGETFYLETVETSKLMIKFDGKTQKQSTSRTTIGNFTVKKMTPRETTLALKVEDIEVKADDAKVDDPLAEKMKGASFTFTLNPSYKITKMEGYEDLVKKIADGKKDVEKQVRENIKEDDFKKNIEDTFIFLPPRGVAKGETWKRETVLPLPPFGSFKWLKTYTYQGKGMGGDTIDLTSAFTFVPPTGENLPKITKGSLKAKDGAGKFIFDVDKGRLVRSTNRVVISGMITFEFQKMTNDIEVEGEQINSMRVLDKNPLAK